MKKIALFACVAGMLVLGIASAAPAVERVDASGEKAISQHHHGRGYVRRGGGWHRGGGYYGGGYGCW